MKKFLSLALSLTMCVTALSAAGCTQDGAQSSTPPPVEQVVEKLQLEKSNLLLTLGDRAELSASYNEIEGATLTWSSSAPNVVSVDENGYVEAMGLGVATITARYGAKQATCLVEVGLSGNVPYLDFENGVDDEITLMKGSEFSIGAFVQFNGKKYYDGNVEYFVSDSSIGEMVGDKFVAKQVGGSTQVSVFASWRGQTVHAKTITVNVIAESTVLLNNGKLMALNVYTVPSHAGVAYATSQTISSVYVSEDGVEIDNYDISILDEGIATIERNGDEWTVSAQKAGKTNLIVSYGVKEFAFDVFVNRPVADTKSFVDYSAFDAKYFDNAAKQLKSIDEMMEGLGKVVSYEYAGKEYKVKDGSLNIPVGQNSTVTLYNDSVGYLVDVTAYTMIIDELQDFEKIYASEQGEVVYGSFILAKDIIEPDTVLDMPANSVANDFAGTFDGKGHSLSFTLDHGSTQAFGLFGKNLQGATIKNVAFTGVKQTGASGKYPAGILCAQGSKLSGIPEYYLENIYVDVSFIEGAGNYFTLMANMMWAAIVKNVIIHVPEIPDGVETAAFARGSSISITNTYVISTAPLYQIKENAPDQTKWVKPVQYANYEEMMAAGNDYSSFSTEFWDVTTYGIPVWKTLVNDFLK